MLANQGSQGPQVPAELQHVRPAALEEYVKGRVTQALNIFVGRLRAFGPSVPIENIANTAQDVINGLSATEAPPVAETRELQLVFRHDCLALGCLDPQCVLCQHNPQRRCNVNFDKKYLVSDQLKAKCGATIRVELIDRSTGAVVEDDMPDIRLEMNVLDGNMYDNKFMETPPRPEDGPEQQQKQLDACSLLLNNRQQPLLACTNGGTNDQTGRVVMQLQRGKAVLPDLHVTDSSEALLSGRKPPFRLLVRAVSTAAGPTRHIAIRHAVSEGFVVATRRTRTAGKVDIPSVDDHVSKLEHMGKETVRKLQDLATAARQAGAEIDIPENCVQKVGEFKQLALRAEQDGHLRQQLQHVLKLSKEKWDEARDHAMRAVVPDNRMRAWYADRRNMEVGLLFTCRLGSVDLDRPVGLLQRKAEGGESKMEISLLAQQTPVQRDAVRKLQPEAAHHWWLHGHPGWAIFPTDTDVFEETGQLLINTTATPSGPPSPAHKPPGPALLLPGASRGHPGAPGSIMDGPDLHPKGPVLPAPPIPPHLSVLTSTPFATANIAAVFPRPPAQLPGQLQDNPLAAAALGAAQQQGPGRPLVPGVAALLGHPPASPLKDPSGASHPIPPGSIPGGGLPSFSNISFPSALLTSTGANLLPPSLDLDNPVNLGGESMNTGGLLFSSLRLPSIDLPEALALHAAAGGGPPSLLPISTHVAAASGSLQQQPGGSSVGEGQADMKPPTATAMDATPSSGGA